MKMKMSHTGQKQKILLIGPDVYSGGVGTHIAQLLQSNLKEAYDFSVFQVGHQGRKENIIQRGIRIIISPFQLAGKIACVRPAIVHMNPSMDPKSFWRDIFYLFVSKLMFRKVVYQIHGGVLPDRFFGGFILNAFLRFVLSLPDAVVVIARDQHVAYGEFSAVSNLTLIPNAINLEEYKDARPKQVEQKRLKVISIGRLSHNKGVKESIEAMGILETKYPDVDIELFIAGTGPQEKNLKSLASSLKKSERIQFLGPVFGEDKIRLWKDADVFVFPTYHEEGLPYVVLESIASGTPVVTTAVRGIPDIVEPDIHCVFVPPEDPSAVADALNHLVNDRQKLHEMSKACIKRAREYYGVERLSGQFEKLYHLLLNGQLKI